MVTYEGIFFEGDAAELIRFLEPVHLKRPIDKLHCTFKYRPSDNEVFDDIVGTEAEITIVGYGCDNNNSGFEITFPDELLPYYLNCDKSDPSKVTIPHITVSLAEDAKAVNTKNLKFEKLSTPIVVKGRLGYCVRDNGKEYISYSPCLSKNKVVAHKNG